MSREHPRRRIVPPPRAPPRALLLLGRGDEDEIGGERAGPSSMERARPWPELEEGRRRGHVKLEVRTLARLARLAPHAAPALPSGRGGEEGWAGEQRLRRPWSRSSAGRPPRPEQRNRRRELGGACRRRSRELHAGGGPEGIGVGGWVGERGGERWGEVGPTTDEGEI
jgi:hypothetical protein